MMTHAATNGNRTRQALAEKALAELLQAALRRGFHGAVCLELQVQDGTIQSIKRRIEQNER